MKVVVVAAAIVACFLLQVRLHAVWGSETGGIRALCGIGAKIWK